jgi:hypothetical protein
MRAYAFWHNQLACSTVRHIFATLACISVAACAPKETPEGNARANLDMSMGQTTSSLASNVSCFSSVEKTATGIDVIKCSYEVIATPLQRAYVEEYCETKANGKCYRKHQAFPDSK